MSRLSATFRPHAVNAWFYRVFTTPYVRVEGRVVPCSWARTTTLDVAPGTHRVETFVRDRRGAHVHPG